MNAPVLRRWRAAGVLMACALLLAMPGSGSGVRCGDHYFDEMVSGR